MIISFVCLIPVPNYVAKFNYFRYRFLVWLSVRHILLNSFPAKGQLESWIEIERDVIFSLKSNYNFECLNSSVQTSIFSYWRTHEPKVQTAGAYIPVFLAWSTPRSIATPPLDGMLVHRWVTLPPPPPPSSMSPVVIYTPGWRETKWSQGNNATGEAWTPGHRIRNSRC